MAMIMMAAALTVQCFSTLTQKCNLSVSEVTHLKTEGFGLRIGTEFSRGGRASETLGLSLIEQPEVPARFVMLLDRCSRSSARRVVIIRSTPAQFLGFQVDDVGAAQSELEPTGVEFVTDVWGDESEAWTYFRGPDSHVYELWQTPRVLKGLTPHSQKGEGH